MRIRLAGVAVVAAASLAVFAGTAPAAKPLTQRQYAEKRLKTSFTAWAKKNLPGTKVGAVSCVLPKNGTVVHCLVHVSAPKNQENIVFKIKETLHETGTMTWAATSHSCTDSKTHKSFPC